MSKRKVALITGGTRGIGFGIARRLAMDKIDLVLNGRRSASEVADTLCSLKEFGIRSEYFAADISKAAEREALANFVKDEFGELHFLVNNAGIAPEIRSDILDASEESFERLISTNLQGPYFLTQLIAKWMIEQTSANQAYSGAICCVTSVSATVASTSRGDYCISKAGMSMASRLWAVRLAEYGIPVYEIRPGIISTDMTAGVKAKYDRLIADGLLLESRWGTPDDVGQAVAALLRGDLPYSTGTVISLDGGLTVPRL